MRETWAASWYWSSSPHRWQGALWRMNKNPIESPAKAGGGRTRERSRSQSVSAPSLSVFLAARSLCTARTCSRGLWGSAHSRYAGKCLLEKQTTRLHTQRTVCISPWGRGGALAVMDTDSGTRLPPFWGQDLPLAATPAMGRILKGLERSPQLACKMYFLDVGTSHGKPAG